MEIRLKKENIKDLDIDGYKFKIDCNDARAIASLNEFKDSQNKIRSFDVETLTTACKPYIDTVLGEGAYNKLFKGIEHSMAPYYLCIDLLKIFQDEFLKEEREKENVGNTEFMKSMKEFTETMKAYNDTMKYANGKYGKYGVSDHKRSSKKFKN